MTFHDLEKALRDFFRTATTRSPRTAYKNSLKTLLHEEFQRAQKERVPFLFWRRLFSRTSSLGFVSVIALTFLNIFPAGEGDTIAGQITPQGGLVEIMREGSVFVLEGSLSLKPGDCVRIGNRSEAEITLGHLTSIAKDRTTVCVQDEGGLFLEQGVLHNKGTGEVMAKRGVSRGDKNTHFIVIVSDSGEMKTIVQKNNLSVFDSQLRRTQLSAGEEISLRTDTALEDVLAPKDLALSDSQLEALASKLIITRTKALASMEAFLQQNASKGMRDLISAEKSFRSLTQVLDSARDLTIIKRRHLRFTTLSEVYDQLSDRTKDVELLQETQAIETLLTLLRRNRTSLGFSYPQTQVQTFNRYVLLEQLFSLSQKEVQKELHVLQKKYIHNFLRKVTNSPLKTLQISTLQKELSKLPKNHYATRFQEVLQKELPYDLVDQIGPNGIFQSF